MQFTGSTLAATGKSLIWPATEAMLLKFVVHWCNPEKRKVDSDHGKLEGVSQNLFDQGSLRTAWPHAPDTVLRRLAS